MPIRKLLKLMTPSTTGTQSPPDKGQAGPADEPQLWEPPTERLSLVFIAGPPRSGTTWLNREICDRAGWSGFLPECTLLTQQIALYSRTKHYGEPKRFAAYFGTAENLASVYRPILRQMLGLARSLNDCPDGDTLLLKDPDLSLYLEDLGDVLPDHRLVCIVRDPRDVIASVKNVSARKKEAFDIKAACTWIYSYYDGIRKHRAQGSRTALFVRYEDLVGGTLDQVRTFLGQSTDADAAQANSGAVEAWLDPSDPFFSELHLKPTTQQKVGSYKTILTRREIAEVEAVFSGVMQDWRYR